MVFPTRFGFYLGNFVVELFFTLVILGGTKKCKTKTSRINLYKTKNVSLYMRAHIDYSRRPVYVTLGQTTDWKHWATHDVSGTRRARYEQPKGMRNNLFLTVYLLVKSSLYKDKEKHYEYKHSLLESRQPVRHRQ